MGQVGRAAGEAVFLPRNQAHAFLHLSLPSVPRPVPAGRSGPGMVWTERFRASQSPAANCGTTGARPHTRSPIGPRHRAKLPESRYWPKPETLLPHTRLGVPTERTRVIDRERDHEQERFRLGCKIISTLQAVALLKIFHVSCYGQLVQKFSQHNRN